MPSGSDTQSHTTVDLLVRISARGASSNGYLTEATINGEGSARRGVFRLDALPAHPATGEDVGYGTALFYELFSGELARAYDRASALAADGGLQLRLRIDETAAELHALNWESMHSLRAGLPSPPAASGHITFSRYQPGPLRGDLPVQTDRVHMVVAMANPTDLDRYGLTPLDPDGEVRALVEALGGPVRSAQLSMTILSGRSALSNETQAAVEALGWRVRPGAASLAAITLALSEGPACHVLHLLCHGAFSRLDGEGRLFLEAADGAAEPVSGTALVVALEGLGQRPALATLAACNSGRRDDADGGNAMVGIAPRLVTAGIPAVVAMQDEVPLRVARGFAVDLYRDLLRRSRVAGAVGRARSRLHQAGDTAWTVPVLVTALGDDRLFAPDPVAQALRSLAASPDLNPLPDADDYIPLTGERVSAAGWTSKAALYVPAPLSGTTQPRSGSDAVHAVLACVRGTATSVVPASATMLVVSGALGSGKSVLLRRVGRLTAEASLAHGATDLVLPVLLDFARDLGPSHGASDLVQMILDVFQAHWPALDFGKLTDLLAAETGPRVRILVDGLEALSASGRDGALRDLAALARIFPRQQIVVATSPVIDRGAELPATHVLRLLPLRPSTVTDFLEARGQVGRDLLEALTYAGALDLASQPWALVKLLGRAAGGQFPVSRFSVVEGILEDDVRAIAGDAAMQHRVMATLDALAWHVARSLSPSLDVDVAFGLMADVRGSRTYDLEALLKSLVERGVLTTCGDDRVRFARAAVQAMCAARALAAGGSVRLLDDIAATLGRRARLYWWWDVLVFHAGLATDPGEAIRQVVFGAPLGSGPFLLAARMVREAGVASVPPSLVMHLLRSLTARLDLVREPRVERRVEVVQALGQIDHPIADARLRSICLSGSTGSGRERMAAFLALRARLGGRWHEAQPEEPTREAASSEGERVLRETLDDWVAEDVAALSQRLVDLEGQTGGREALFPLVAFAITSLQTPAALEVLVQLLFYARDLHRTAPSLTTALRVMDGGEVTRRVLLPVIDGGACRAEGLPDEVCGARARYVPAVIPLAGHLAASDGRLVAFLRRTVIAGIDVACVAPALLALGQAGDTGSRETLEAVATGDLSVLEGLGPVDPGVCLDLQRRAIAALGRVGDGGTLRRLQSETDLWVPELELALTAACEEMMWREITTETEGQR